MPLFSAQAKQGVRIINQKLNVCMLCGNLHDPDIDAFFRRIFRLVSNF